VPLVGDRVPILGALTSPTRWPPARYAGSVRLEGRIALVTGAGSPTGIGFAAARALGRAGARVAIASTTDRIHERVSDLAAQGIAATGHVRDLMASGAAAALVQEVLAAHGGRLDILVNNAGMVAVGAAEEGTEIAAMRANGIEGSTGTCGFRSR
jgi:NAD(P)-dependent dehydrogenase (short-subunit alcohol dehydrogenase family)